MLLQAITEGLFAGLILSIFIGPIFFSTLQLGVEHGFNAAFALAAGQWMSDFIFIFLAFWGATWVENIVQDPTQQAVFVWYSGTIGGCLLLLFGMGLLLTKSVSTEGSNKIEIQPKISTAAYWAYGSQGFLINTINPTPLLFWMGLMAFAINKKYSNEATVLLYSSVMFMVIATDLLKISLAKNIRNKLKPHHILKVRRLAGLILGGFGLTLLVKVFLL